ncbi:UNVERIFIED_CONTAM: hypothetical protein Scaly_1788200 [Sesamum calycinum]|uniref:Reverse transcriptase domain-containing protein n=1 Tax=Sesamum calycinum TaxID=2727403 RepID=A0AAW2NVY5_9LAMI
MARRPIFTSRSSLQSQPEPPPPHRGASIFGTFGTTPTTNRPHPTKVFSPETTPPEISPSSPQQGSPAVHHESARLELLGVRGLLDSSTPKSSRAWLCAGDFNEILDQSEKLGGPPRPVWQIRNFREALAGCSLSDLGFTGTPFTWCNGHSLPTTVRERLDRACANLEWSRLFPNVSVKHEPVNCSDHAAEGDRNTGFFHRKASHRFRTNSILRIRNLDGDWVYTEDGIRNCISSYFGTVYASTYPSLEAIAKETEHVRTIIDASMRDDLLQPFTTSEVTKALFEMAPLKSPGPNAIANRMKPILDRIISPSQSTFVPGRLISDNILLAFELNHFLNSKSRGEQGWMALKLDVSKAYDKVEWSFLEQVMSKLEAFSSLLQQAEEEGRLRGIAVCRGAPSVSHLLFADDMLIFCQASLESSLTVREILDIYRGASAKR